LRICLPDKKRKQEDWVESVKKRLTVVADEIAGVDTMTESGRSLRKRKENVTEIHKDELENIKKDRDSKIAQAQETFSNTHRTLQLQLKQAQEALNFWFKRINDEANKEMHTVEVKRDKLIAELDVEIDSMTTKEGTPNSSENFRMLRNIHQDKEHESIQQQLFLEEESLDRISEEYDTKIKDREYTSMHVTSGM
jgi:septum formation inhibitor MinC